VWAFFKTLCYRLSKAFELAIKSYILLMILLDHTITFTLQY